MLKKRSVLNTRASQGEAATTYGAGYPVAMSRHGRVRSGSIPIKGSGKKAGQFPKM